MKCILVNSCSAWIHMVAGQVSSRLGGLSGFPPISCGICFRQLVRGLGPRLLFWDPHLCICTHGWCLFVGCWSSLFVPPFPFWMDAFSFIYFGRVSSIHKGNKIAQVNVCKSIPVLATPETFLENNQWPAPHCNQISHIVFIIVLSHWMHLRSRGQSAIPKIAWFPSREKGPWGDMSSRYISRNSNLTPMKWSEIWRATEIHVPAHIERSFTRCPSSTPDASRHTLACTWFCFCRLWPLYPVCLICTCQQKQKSDPMLTKKEGNSGQRLMINFYSGFTPPQKRKKTHQAQQHCCLWFQRKTKTYESSISESIWDPKFETIGQK